MTARLRLTKVDWTRAATLAQQGHTIRFEPDGAIIILPPAVDIAVARRKPASVDEWRKRRDEDKTRGRP